MQLFGWIQFYINYIRIKQQRIRQIMPILYYTDYSNPDFTQQRVVSSFLNIELPIQQIANKYSPLALVDESVLLN